jgi:hypothetical protein
MLYKIWGFHGGDYEECRLLGYKNPVRTSQETHYASVIMSSRLILCNIWDSHGGDYEKWNETPCGSCKNRRLWEMYHLHHQGGKNQWPGNKVSSKIQTEAMFRRNLLITDNVSSSLFLFALMMDATLSSETSILTRVAHHHILEEGILHSHCRENLKSYILWRVWLKAVVTMQHSCWC